MEEKNMKTVLLFVFAGLFCILSFAQDYKGSSAPNTYQEKLNEEYCSGLFHSTDGIIIDVSSDASARAYFNILDWLQGRVAGYQVYKNRYGTSIPVIRGGVPAVFIDEIQVSPAGLNSISMNDIAIVKIIKTPFYGGFNGGNGAIAIYTKGDEEEDE
jgi:hypothetical protein